MKQKSSPSDWYRYREQRRAEDRTIDLARGVEEVPSLVGQRWVLMVAQVPFEVDVAQGTRRETFCTLRPIVGVDGTTAMEDDFPNQGLTFWLVDSSVRDLAKPGTLVVGRLEHATKAYDPDDDRSHLYQIDPDDVSQLTSEDGIEILTIRDSTVRGPLDLIRPSPVFRSRRPVGKTVLARWNGSLWGPFAAEESPADPFDPSKRDVRLEPPSDYVVHRIAESKFTSLPRASRCKGTAAISLISQLPSRSSRVDDLEYELLVGTGLPSLLRLSDEKLSLRPARVVILQLGKTLLTRRQRQELSGLLDVLAEKLPESDAAVEEDAVRVLDSVREGLRHSNAEIAKLSDAIIASGLLQERLDQAIALKTEDAIRERSIAINAQAESRAKSLTEELESLRKQKESLASELDAKRRRAADQLGQELADMRSRHEADLKSRLDEVAAAETRLKQLEHSIRDQIASLTSRFESGRRELVDGFVAMLPLLRQLDLIPGASRPAEHAPVTTASATLPRTDAEQITLPPFVHAARSASQTFADEAAFVDHVLERSAKAGLEFRRLDVVAFHASLKCGGLTALGGASGTGKSSLCRVYGQSIGASGQALSRFLPVTVNPSWLDSQDLLGHVNALTRSFQPAEARLFEQLVAAHEEFNLHGDASGMYVICLDEMNLAQPEHYFNSFLQLIERPADQRRLNVFSQSAVSPLEPFRDWSEILIPPTVQFVGTVNFDETTRALSLRLLDRTNLIRLRPTDTITNEAAVTDEGGSLTGDGVSYRQWRTWSRAPLESPKLLAEILQAISPALESLGCPITPRRHRGMRRFLGNAAGLCSMEDAVDLQVAMRVLPQVRGLVRRSAKDAIGQIRGVLEGAVSPMRESLRVLGEIEAAEFDDPPSFEE